MQPTARMVFLDIMQVPRMPPEMSTGTFSCVFLSDEVKKRVLLMVFLSTLKISSWNSWHPLKRHTWFSWQPWQDHAGTFFMASMLPYMVLGYGCQERSTRDVLKSLLTIGRSKVYLKNKRPKNQQTIDPCFRGRLLDAQHCQLKNEKKVII